MTPDQGNTNLSANQTQPKKTLIVIAGPTAVGKTATAIQLAIHYDTVIVSADSRQFYREMCIGTAKPTSEELSEVKHYFIDSFSVTDNYTAGDYEKECIALLAKLFEQHDKIVLVGGSGLFIKAVCEGFDNFPEVTPATRESLNNELKDNGIDYLQRKLALIDYEYYQSIDKDNPQRLIRALEVYETSGKPFSSYLNQKSEKHDFNIIKIGLNLPRDLLYKRINMRVDSMIAQGLVKEAKSLIKHRHLNALNTVGYTELFNYFDGKTSLVFAVELIKQNTRRFAKRQLTWFNKDKAIIWFRADKQTLLDEIITIVEKNS